MTTRRLIAVLIAVVMSLGALAPLHGAALPDDGEPDPLPVRRAVLPAGDFIGTLRIVAGTMDAAGQLHLTGLLTGTATQRTRGRLPVTEQPFTVPVILRDAGRTTDVVRLVLAPIALAPGGMRVKLAPITVDLEALPDVGEELAILLPQP
jgi:hypothetical protein